MPYGKINFPTVFYLDDLQMCFDGAKATETEQFIINALLQGCGTVDQLGRRTQEKIKMLMEGYARRVEVNEQDYSRIFLQVNGYKVGAIQMEDISQPHWVQEAERAEQIEYPI